MATANKVERYPGEEHFVDGYVPQSLNAEYSSLHRSSTWIGMGMLLASLAGWGTFIFGLGVTVYGTHGSHTHGVVSRSGEIVQAGGDFNAMLFVWGGLIAALILDIGGLLMIRTGRSAYRAYVRQYGGHH